MREPYMEKNTNTTRADRPKEFLTLSGINVLCMDGRKLVMIVMYCKAVVARFVRECKTNFPQKTESKGG